MDRHHEQTYTNVMTLQQLRVLVYVVDCASFSAAALELGVGQSSVSYTIAELEEELGVRVVSRGRFGAIPTEAGKRIAAHARQVLELTEVIVQEAHLENGVLQGRLRIGTFRSVAGRILPGIVAELRKHYPSLTIGIHEASGSPGCMDTLLHEGHVDVAFAQPEMAEKSVFWELLRDPYVAALPVGKWKNIERIHLERLIDEPFVLSGPAQMCAQPIATALQAINPAFRPAYEIGEDSTILSMVAQGLGVTVMPSLAIDSVPPGVRLVELETPVHRTIGIALLPHTLKVPAVRAFLTSLKRRFPKSPIPPFTDLTMPARTAPEQQGAS